MTGNGTLHNRVAAPAAADPGDVAGQLAEILERVARLLRTPGVLAAAEVPPPGKAGAPARGKPQTPGRPAGMAAANADRVGAVLAAAGTPLRTGEVARRTGLKWANTSRALNHYPWFVKTGTGNQDPWTLSPAGRDRYARGPTGSTAGTASG